MKAREAESLAGLAFLLQLILIRTGVAGTGPTGKQEVDQAGQIQRRRESVTIEIPPGIGAIGILDIRLPCKENVD